MSNDVLENVRMITKNDKILFKQASYSMNELLSVMSTISENATRSAKSNLEFGYVLDEFNNTVEVMIYQDEINKTLSTVERVNSFKKGILVSPVISYSFTSAGFEEYATVKAGGIIGTSPNNGTFSVGYRAKNSWGVLGFITAGHACDKVGLSIYSGAVEIGKVSSRHYYGSYGIDASFVEIGAGHSVSSAISGTIDAHAPVIQTPYVGLFVAKSGANGYSSGYIKTLDARPYSTMLGGYVGATYSSSGGDSGGIVYCADITTQMCPVVGIVTGGMTDSTHGRISFFTSAARIRDEYGITPY